MKFTIRFSALMVFFVFGAVAVAGYGYEIDNSADAYYYYLQGLFLEKEGNFKGAIEAYNQALVFDAQHAPVHVQLGEAYNMNGDAEQAKKEALAAIRTDDKYLPAYFLLGAIYVQQNKLAEALAVYEKITSLDPENFTALYVLGNMYLNTGNYQGAVEKLRKVCELVPDYAEAYLALAAAGNALKEFTMAEAAYRKVIEIVPGNLLAYFGLAETFEREKKNEEAIAAYRQILNLDGGNALAHYHLGALYYDQKDYEKSAPEFQAVAKNIKDDLSISSYFYLGVISEELKSYDQGIAYYEQCLEVARKIAAGKGQNRLTGADIRPLQNAAYLHLGYIFLQQNKPKKALQVMKTAIATDSDNLLFNYFMGIVYGELNDYDRAIDSLKRALTLKARHALVLNYASKEPELDELYFRLGVLYDQAKDFAACEENMKLSMSYNSRNAQALNYLGYSYADREVNLPQAEEYIKKALAIEPNNGAYLDSLGWLYFRQQRYDEALAYLQRSIDLLKDDPSVLEHLGDVYAALLDWEEAEKYWRRSLAANPENKKLRKKLQENLQNLPQKSK